MVDEKCIQTLDNDDEIKKKEEKSIIGLNFYHMQSIMLIHF